MPSLAEEFALFWQRFPRRTAKLDAMKAYERARRTASAADILDGIGRYMENKPEYADWCHPATFLNKGRWMDEYDEPVRTTTASDWGAECLELHGGLCSKRWDHEMKKRA